MDILSFEARYPARGANPTIVVALAARLTRSDGRVLDQREFSASIPAEGDRVSLIVKAFNQAVAKILADIVSWTDEEVPSAPAADAPSPAMTTTTSTTSTSQTVTEVQH
jgi:cholesterol transport system auxiliary component